MRADAGTCYRWLAILRAASNRPVPAIRLTSPRNYLICATQRCGSTLLCEWFDQSGVLGHPNEYLLLWEQYSDRQEPGFWELVVQETLDRGRGDNGVFGCKVMANQFPRAVQWLRRVDRARELGDWQVGCLAFGDPEVIWVRRRDRVRQAVSRYISLQTGGADPGRTRGW